MEEQIKYEELLSKLIRKVDTIYEVKDILNTSIKNHEVFKIETEIKLDNITKIVNKLEQERERHMACSAPALALQNKEDLQKLIQKVEKLETETDVVRFHKKYPGQQKLTLIGLIVVGLIGLIPTIKLVFEFIKHLKTP